MSTKEISDITYQSYDTLSTVRYRLRKKLGMNDHANFISYSDKKKVVIVVRFINLDADIKNYRIK